MADDTTTPTLASTLEFPLRRHVVAGIADDAVATVTDLHPRGRADEIEAALRETHLPALEEAGYIEWDRESGEISPGPQFSEAADHLAELPDMVYDPNADD
ncbi:MAG: hypothetical protein A07HR67_01182 [uncultured archaeon A07HR67]|jgi:hypothetical protein|nr:MAG: hypothetical protein A07HR67_01182 [uncultured archaeon A07HR67]